jgi:hypothetical protein
MPFQPGQSGNPAGRPRDARSKTTILLEELIERDGEVLTRHFIEQAKRGNARALGCLMGMILPKRKGAPIEIDLPPLEQASDVPVAIAAIIAAVCGGELTPEEGTSLTRMVEAFLRATQKVEKLGRKPERAAEAAAAKMREAAEPHVLREGEARSPHAAMVQADGGRQAAAPSVHSPAVGGGRIVSPLLISEGLVGRSLPRLRQDALSSTSALAHGAAGQAPIVSPLLISPVSPPAFEETRAAA